MKKIRILLLFLLLIPFISVRSQNSIQLMVLQDLSSLDLGTFLMSNSLSGQPRIFQLIISTQPQGRNIFLTGRVDWRQNQSSSAQNVFNFQTKVFKARSLFNDEIGNSDIQIESIQGDKNLAKDIALKGKPSGIFDILITMFTENNQYLGIGVPDHPLVFLNPAPTINITYPVPSSNVDVGNVQISWTEVQGATKYEILAGEVTSDNQTIDDAGSLIVDAKDIDKNATTYRIERKDQLRDWRNGGQKVAVVVKAFYLDSGKETEIRSNSIVFNVGQASSSDPGNNLQPDVNMVRLANLLGSKVDQSILDKLKNGTIKLDQVQIQDENGQSISSSDFLSILTLLESKNPSELTIKFTPNQ